MPTLTGTGGINQNRQNSNLQTYGLNVMNIMRDPTLNTQFFYLLLGSGPQQTRINKFNKNNG